MSEKRGTKALELWCRRITDGYPGVNVQNMSTSWRDGLAFCAMIHHFRPDLIDFDSLDKNDIYGNNELAFRTAEQYLGIPALLDAEDMASCSVPDRLSILTYLSQFYQTFGGTSPARLAVNRTTESTGEKIAQVPESPNEKAVVVPRQSGVRKDLCAVCGLPVFLAEKLVLSRVSYHRTCFRCARCNSQLTLGNYYETEEGQYCCESCPDEEISPSGMRHSDEFVLPSVAGAASEFFPTDTLYKQSTSSEDRAVNDIIGQSLNGRRFDQKSSYIPDSVERTSRLRLNFVSSQLFPDESERSPSVDHLPASDENYPAAVQRDDEKFQVTCNGGTSVSISDDSFGTHHGGTEIRESPDLSSKSESPDNSGIESNEDSRTEVNGRDGDESTETSLRDSRDDKSASSGKIGESLPRIDQRVQPETAYSLVQERRKMFEGKKSPRGENKTEPLMRSKSQTIERETIVNSMPGLTSTIKTAQVSREIDTKDSATNLSDAEKSEKICETVRETSSSSSSPAPISVDNSNVPLPEEEKIVDDRTRAPVATESERSDATEVKKDEDYPEDLNPFKSEEEEDPGVNESTNKDIGGATVRDGIATNPFDVESDAEMEESRNVVAPVKPAVRSSLNQTKVGQRFLTEETAKRRLTAPQINLNPFWSDDDDCDSETDCSREPVNEVTPVPKPRNIRHVQEITPERTPKHKDACTLNSPIRSPESGVGLGGAYRKKKPAPMPPGKRELSSDRSEASPSKITGNAGAVQESTSHETPKTRKTKRAPQPPIPVSGTVNNVIGNAALNFPEPYIDKQPDVNGKRNIWEDEKTNKDEANRNRQSVTRGSYEGNFYYKPYVNKSVEGKWKKKKGPAPPCPTPHRRKIKVMSLKDVKLELDEIELQQQGLEKQGVRLEQLIRSKCESGPRTNDISLGSDIEELVLELFSLVNEKNELFRRQAELMLLRRQQRLEEEHAEVEYEIRCLMSQHESTKTDYDKQKEEALIQRLVEIVERRNEIVDCLEMDRRREIEEDRSIHRHMDLFVAKNKSATTNNDVDTRERKKHKQNKHKESGSDAKLKKMNKKDIDKDIDEIELKLKGHSKRKWF